MSSSMIPRVKELKLIAIYLYINDICKQELQYSCQRFSNNATPAFTDEEIMTIYLYSMQVEQRFKVKQIYEFASDHLRSWFPLLPSYEAFIMRLNRLGEAFKMLSAYTIEKFIPADCLDDTSVVLI